MAAVIALAILIAIVLALSFMCLVCAMPKSAAEQKLEDEEQVCYLKKWAEKHKK